jgi:hypothetical protein
MKRRMFVLVNCVVGTMMVSEAVLACPSCYGAADGPMIQGMNMAILTMLGITGVVLAAISSFFVMMWRRVKRLRSGKLTHAFVNEQGMLEWNNS